MSLLGVFFWVVFLFLLAFLVFCVRSLVFVLLAKLMVRVALEFYVLFCAFPVENVMLACFATLASPNQNFRIFAWFLLYSPTFLHATMYISRGFASDIGLLFVSGLISVNFLVSLAMVMLFFRMTVFFLLEYRLLSYVDYSLWLCHRILYSIGRLECFLVFWLF